MTITESSRVPDLKYDNRDNYFGYINSTDPDAFGILRFLTDELQDAEDAGDRGRFSLYEYNHTT